MQPTRPSTLQPRRTHENPPSLPYGIHHAQRRTRMPRRPPLGLRCGSRAHRRSGQPQRSSPHVERIDRIRRNRPGKRRPRRRAHTQRGIPWHGHFLAAKQDSHSPAFDQRERRVRFGVLGTQNSLGMEPSSRRDGRRRFRLPHDFLRGRWLLRPRRRPLQQRACDPNARLRHGAPETCRVPPACKGARRRWRHHSRHLRAQ